MANHDDIDAMDFGIPTEIDDQSDRDQDTQDIRAQLAALHFEKGVTLYPVYFCRSPRNGRRVPAHLSVPLSKTEPLTAWHLAEACTRLGLSCMVEEMKRHPRDYWTYGRVKVQFDKSAGATLADGTRVENSNFILISTISNDAAERALMNAVARVLPEARRACIDRGEIWGHDPIAVNMLKSGLGALVPLAGVTDVTANQSGGKKGKK
jgi:signal recognition particle subunit SEC65